MTNQSIKFCEILLRTLVKGQELDYQMPYFDQVNSDPSIEEMKVVVCDQKIRPELPQQWDTIEVITLTSVTTRVSQT